VRVTKGNDEYARRARAVPRITGSQAAELAVLAQGGDPQAHSHLLNSHRRIVAILANRYARSDLTPEERIRLGEQGLGVAIEKFDLEKGFSFSTYATWWIRQAITMGLGGDAGGVAVREPRSPGPAPGSATAAV
jgi:DNA-directed RNA polymerase sigma subunit (sigma70/sigma32)